MGILFYRYDTFRFGGHGPLHKKFPLFADVMTLPRMYYIPAGEKKPLSVHPEVFGWEAKNTEQELYVWITLHATVVGFQTKKEERFAKDREKRGDEATRQRKEETAKKKEDDAAKKKRYDAAKKKKK